MGLKGFCVTGHRNWERAGWFILELAAYSGMWWTPLDGYGNRGEERFFFEWLLKALVSSH